MWEGVGDRTELQHIDPYSIGNNRVSFPFPWAAQPMAWGPSLSGTCSHSSIFSPTRFFPNSSDLQTLNRGPKSSLCCVLTFSSASCSNWLNFLCTELYKSQRPPSCGPPNRTHSTHPRSRLYSAIHRPDAPVIYTGSFPILTARPGGWSICNIYIYIYIYIYVCVCVCVCVCWNRLLWIWQYDRNM